MNMSIDFLSSLYRLDMASFKLFDSIETIVGENDVVENCIIEVPRIFE